MDNDWTNSEQESNDNNKKKRLVTVDLKLLDDIHFLINKIDNLMENNADNEAIHSLREDDKIYKSPLHLRLSSMVTHLEGVIQKTNDHYDQDSKKKAEQAALEKGLAELREYAKIFNPDLELEKLDIERRWKRLMGEED